MLTMKTVAGAVALSLLPGCLGPNNAHNSVRNWNATLADEDWIEEIVFLGFHIIPVYQLAYLGDVLIFNTIDYWTDDNPVNDPGEFPAADFTGK